MSKSVEIKNELEKTDLRIKELETELGEQTSQFEAVQSEFIAGKTDIDRLHAEQQKANLLAQAIEALKATAEKMKSAFGMQSAAENRRQTIQTMASASNQVSPLLNDYQKSRNELNDIIAKHAAILIEKRTAYQNKQYEYQTALASLDSPVTDAEKRQGGLNAKACNLASRTFFNHPPVEYDRAIRQAEDLLAELKARLKSSYMQNPAATDEDFERDYPLMKSDYLRNDAAKRDRAARESQAAAVRNSF